MISIPLTVVGVYLSISSTLYIVLAWDTGYVLEGKYSTVDDDYC